MREARGGGGGGEVTDKDVMACARQMHDSYSSIITVSSALIRFLGLDEGGGGDLDDPTVVGWEGSNFS